jgi:8-oxo-dGTP pyrophosphatase MutT (NUDIX family)
MTYIRRDVVRHHHMVCFDDGADRFQMRAAGIAIRDGRVLVQNIKGDPITFIPGGRVDQNESSVETLVREIEEEFGRTVEAGPLLFVIESFYPEKAQLFHEVGFYFSMSVPDDFPYHETEICHRCFEGPVEMEYRWIPANAAVLIAASFYPQCLRDRLLRLPSSTEHIIERELG